MINRLDLLLDKWFQGKYWTIRLTIVAGFIALFLGSPRLEDIYLAKKRGQSIFPKLMSQANSLEHFAIQSRGFNPSSHESKCTFRLALPVFLHFTPLNEYSYLLLQTFFGFLFFYSLTKSTLFILKNDKLITIYIILSTTFLYIGRIGFIQIGNDLFYDSFAYSLIFLSMYTPNLWIILPASALSFWIDERAVFSICLVWVFWFVESSNPFLSYIKSRISIGIIIMTVVMVIARLILAHKWSIPFIALGKGDSNALTVFFENLKYIQFQWLKLFEGFWFIIFVAAWLVYKNKNYLIILTISALFILGSLISFIVFDIARSLAYIFPVALISLTICEKYLTSIQLKKMLFLVLVTNMLIPSSVFLGEFVRFGTETNNGFLWELGRLIYAINNYNLFK